MNMKKKHVFSIGHYYTIVYALIYYPCVFYKLIDPSFNSTLFPHEIIFVQLLTVVPIIIFWIYCIVIWNRKDKYFPRLLLIIFLQSIYISYNDFKIKKNNLSSEL